MLSFILPPRAGQYATTAALNIRFVEKQTPCDFPSAQLWTPCELYSEAMAALLSVQPKIVPGA